MAYVNDRPDSGQVIILAGFLVAVGILVMATFLNGLIFAQDLSTRNDGIDERSVLGFDQDAQRTTEGVISSIGHNSSGNITQSDLYDDASQPAADFNDAMEEYRKNGTRGLERRKASVAMPGFGGYVSDGDTSWFVGQRGVAEIQNETGGESFNVVENEGNVENFRRFVFHIDKTDFDSSLGGNFSVFVSDNSVPPGDPNPGGNQQGFGNVWELTYAGNLFGLGDDEIVVNATTGGSTSITTVDGTDIKNADNLTVEIDLTGSSAESCISVEKGDCITQNLLGDELKDNVDIDTIQFLRGTYVNRFEGEYYFEIDGGGSNMSNPDEVVGPCDGGSNSCVVDHPNSPGDSTLHTVVTVREAEFEMSYIDSSTTYNATVSARTQREDLPFEGVERP